MKAWLIALCVTSVAASASAITKKELDSRISKLTSKFEAMQSKSDKKIPASALQKAKGIILLDRTKAGFLFAYQGGHGVAMVKDPKTGEWSPPAFINANEASLGFQIGGQQTFVAILLMNTNMTASLAESKFRFGGEASGTAGASHTGVEGVATTGDEELTLVYTDKEGLYGGAALKGDNMSPDTNANIAYYGQFYTTREILFEKKPKPTDAAGELAKRIQAHSKAKAGS